MISITFSDVELHQFIVGEDWFVFTTHLVIHAPIDRLLAVVIDILDNKPDVLFIEDLDLVNAIEVYKEEHYPEQCLSIHGIGYV